MEKSSEQPKVIELTKREHFAIEILKSMLHKPNRYNSDIQMVKDAVWMSGHLIECLEDMK